MLIQWWLWNEKATKNIIAYEVNGYKSEEVEIQQAGFSYRVYIITYNHYDV